ncbi:hypothetical protein MUK42_36630 [Musa troglodytarum]|uniref:Uncharacterized protein n=1 Tax=Musa troglodytarum TaxID=320322 RepID=A0A9E7JW75_9LILI|nr:hypothetical protein MUK42_36630 [Musa troglodytarum]
MAATVEPSMKKYPAKHTQVAAKRRETRESLRLTSKQMKKNRTTPLKVVEESKARRCNSILPPICHEDVHVAPTLPLSSQP